jgi:hypothetical protein
MQHLSNTARGRLAQNQQDLLRIAMNSSPIKEENLEHPICEVGFSEYTESGLERMSDYTFLRMLTTLFKLRPASRLWDVVPDVPYTEDRILIESPEAFKMSFEEKAQFLKDEFLRRPKMVGFKMELHNVERKTDRGSTGEPSVSFTVYEANDDLGGAVIPVTIRTRYRTNF